MATLNGVQLRKLIKESVKEVLADNDFIKMIVSEAVKTAIVTVLTEANKPEPQINQMQVNERKRLPQKVDNSMFGTQLASDILGNANVPQFRSKQESISTSTKGLKEDGLFTDPTLAGLRVSKPVIDIDADTTMEEPDWLVSKLGLK